MLGLIAIISFLIPIRPTVSYLEKRELAKFPEFSVKALLSGDYFDDITLWYSDTFPGREEWIQVANYTESFHGYSEISIEGTLPTTVGMAKADAVAMRCRDINPDITVHPICSRYEAASRERFFTARYDYIIDAIDLVACKLDLIQTALGANIPIISALGTGNKLDPSRLRICDISETYGCPLARVMRRELRRRGIERLRVIFSDEQAAPTAQLEAPPPGRRSVPASNAWVPPCAGLMLGGAVVMALAEGRKDIC